MPENLLSREECGLILKSDAGNEHELEDYEISMATDVRGFLGEYYRLILYNKNKENVYKYFIKSIPMKIAEPGKFRIFQKETELYNTLIKDMQHYSSTQWCPQSYYTRPDILVLQDLRTLGYEKCRHSEESLTANEMKGLLNALAVIHASSIVLEVRKGIVTANHYPEYIFDEITVSKDIAYFTTGLRTIMDLAKMHPSYQTTDLKHFIANDLEKCLRRVYGMINPSSKYRNVFCHRDSWRDNILFKYLEGNVGVSAILVDFQTCRYCPPCIDLLLAIFMNQDLDMRQSRARDYILWYYERFKSELSLHSIIAGEYLPFEELLESYENFKLFAYVYRVLAAMMIRMPPELITNEYKYVERTATLTGHLAFDKKLRCFFEKCIGELVDYVLLEKSNDLDRKGESMYE